MKQHEQKKTGIKQERKRRGVKIKDNKKLNQKKEKRQ
jgi:hypothetical protein